MPDKGILAGSENPQTQARRTQGRRNRQNGYMSEHRGERILEPFGFHRQVQSGKVKVLPGDLVRDIPDGRVMRRLENKRRKGGWPTLDTWLTQGSVQGLRLDPGEGGPVKYVLPEEVFLTLLQEAGYNGLPVVASLADLLRKVADDLDERHT